MDTSVIEYCVLGEPFTHKILASEPLQCRHESIEIVGTGTEFLQFKCAKCNHFMSETEARWAMRAAEQ